MALALAIVLAAATRVSADGGALVLDVPSCAALMQFNTRRARVYREGEAVEAVGASLHRRGAGRERRS